MKQSSSSQKRNIITLDDDSEELHPVGTGHSSTGNQAPSSSEASSSRSDASIALSLLIGDRAQMERERLERQRAKQALPQESTQEAQENSTPPIAHGTKRASSPNSKNESVGPKKKVARTADAIDAERGSGTSNRDAKLYWHGSVHKSFNIYADRDPGTRFEELLRPTTPFRANGLTHVIMASYCEDIQWLAAMFPKGANAPEITMVTLAPGSEIKPGVYAPLHPDLPNWIRLVLSRRGLTEYTTMHMKFMLLFYPDRLRLLLLSGNLVSYDWENIENSAFVHDFPRLPDGQKDTTSEYGSQMRRVLSSLSVPSGHHANREMTSYDMHSTCEARLVISIPTPAALSGWSAIEELGIGRLAKLAKELLQEKTPVTIEAQGSSMGTYSPRWLQQFHIACTGGDYRKTLPLPIGNKANKIWAAATGCDEGRKWPPIKLLFPSEKWVKTRSIEGVNGALTFFGKSKAAVEKGFIELLHQPESVRGNIMMHHKAILALKSDNSKKGSGSSSERSADVIGWVYMGSHNLTQAAWGNISLPKQGKEPQMSIGNWELGLVLPVRANDLQQDDIKVPQSMAARAVTWKRPVQKYASTDIPWDQFKQ